MAEGQAVAQPTAHEAARAVVDGWFKKPEAPKAETKAEPKATPAAEVKAEPEQQVSEETRTEATATETAAETTTTEERRRLKLKYKGEEREVDESEAIELAQKGYDYTQKSQALAKERTELQENNQKQIAEEQKQYSEKLKYFETALWHAIAPEMRNIDWNALARDDPAQWAQKMQAATNVNNLLQAVKSEQERVTQATRDQAKAKYGKYIEESREILQNDIPGWNTALYESVMKSGMDYGYSREEVTQMVDHRAIKVLHDAMKYRALQKAKPEMEKKVAAVPKVTKPGTVGKPDSGADKLKDAMTKLHKTGKDKEALAVAKQLV